MRTKCEKDLKERLRNVVIFIKFQAFKDLYVHVSYSLKKKKLNNLIWSDLFTKVLATLPKQVHHQIIEIFFKHVFDSCQQLVA